MNKTLILVVLASCLALPLPVASADAGDDGVVHGSATSNSRAPLSGAKVVLMKWGRPAGHRNGDAPVAITREAIEETTADDAGRYSFKWRPDIDEDDDADFMVRVVHGSQVGSVYGSIGRRDGRLVLLTGDSERLDVVTKDAQPIPEAEVPADMRSTYARAPLDAYGCYNTVLTTSKPRWSRLNQTYVDKVKASYWYTYGTRGGSSVGVGFGIGGKGVVELTESGKWYESNGSTLSFPKRTESYDASTQFTYRLVRESCYDQDSKRYTFFTHSQPADWILASAAAKINKGIRARHCVDHAKGVTVTVNGSKGFEHTREIEATMEDVGLKAVFKASSTTDFNKNNTLRIRLDETGRLCGENGYPTGSGSSSPRRLKAQK